MSAERWLLPAVSAKVIDEAHGNKAHEVCPADAAKPAQQDCTHVRNIVMGKLAHDERSDEQGNGVHDE